MFYTFFLPLLLLLGLANGAFAQNVAVIKADQRRENATQDDYLDPALKPFYHGVASGDPLADRVILWTRVTPEDGSQAPIDVAYKIATDLALANVVKTGAAQALFEKDFTLKLDAEGLLPNTYYFFQFETGGVKSVVGRTKTAPATAVENVKLAVLSCSDYRDGYFTGLRKLTERNDIDLVLHTGDYIYEGGGGPAHRRHEPNAEMYRLQDYRTRFSQYRLDPDLRYAHQIYPWITIWDDHDIVVDALRDTSYRHNAAAFGPYYLRKHAAIQAAREWLPMRDPADVDVNFYKNWRKISYGGLLDLFSIDVRLYDRDRFAANVDDTLYGKPDHKLLGPEQLNWLNTELKNSTAQWKVINNGLMIAQLMIVDRPLIMENWDGYPAERNAFFQNLKDNSINNVVFVTGDFHCAFANDLCPNPFDPMVYDSTTGAGSLAVEFIAPSLSAGNFDEGDDFGLPSPSNAVGLIRTVSPHTKMVEVTSHGYILLDLTPQRAQAEFWFMENHKDRYNNNERLYDVWLTRNGQNRLEKGAAAAAPKPNQPEAPEAPVIASRPAEAGNHAVAVLSLAPNPANAETFLNFALTAPQKISLTLTDMQGKTVKKLGDETLAKGNYFVPIDLSDFPAGLYSLRFTANQYRYEKKLVKE